MFNKLPGSMQYKAIIVIYSENETILVLIKIVNEYDQELPQSQTVDNPMAPKRYFSHP